MKTLFLILMLIFTSVSAQEIDKKYLTQTWHSHRGEKGAQVYYTAEHSKMKKVAFYELKSGLELAVGGKAIQHRFKQCGNDPMPSFYEGKWIWKEAEKNVSLTIKFKGSQQHYQVVKLTATELILKAIHTK